MIWHKEVHNVIQVSNWKNLHMFYIILIKIVDS